MKAQATAYQKFLHIAPRKLRLVADAIRGQKVEKALTLLKFSTKHASETMEKILTQAKSNAVNVHNTPESSLIVKAIMVEEGPRIKRWRPVARGMAHAIVKRTSHIKIVVEGDKAELVKKSATKKVEPKVESTTKKSKEVKPEAKSASGGEGK